MAASPGLAALSVAMHGSDRAVARAFMAGLTALPANQAPAYYENAYGMAPPAVRQILEDLAGQ